MNLTDLFPVSREEYAHLETAHFRRQSTLKSLRAAFNAARHSPRGHTESGCVQLPLSLFEQIAHSQDEDRSAFIAGLELEQRDYVPSPSDIIELHGGVLEDAMALLAIQNASGSYFYEQVEALYWIARADWEGGVHASDIPFSFWNCCKAFGLDPDAFRMQLMQTQEYLAVIGRINGEDPVLS